jgi:hypothetical protein
MVLHVPIRHGRKLNKPRLKMGSPGRTSRPSGRLISETHSVRGCRRRRRHCESQRGCRWSVKAPTLHGGKRRSLRREGSLGIVWPGIHHPLDKRNSKRAAPCRCPSYAGHWTATYSCSLLSSWPHGPLTAVFLYLHLYSCNACLHLSHHARLAQLPKVTWPERVAVALPSPNGEQRARQRG